MLQDLKTKKLKTMRILKKLLLVQILFTCYLSNAQISKGDLSSLPIDSITNCHIRYYYYPNIEAYFDNLELVYHYKVKGQWEKAENLPTNYGGTGLTIYNLGDLLVGAGNTLISLPQDQMVMFYNLIMLFQVV